MPKPDVIDLGGDEIPILHEDRSVLAIDKPAGWVIGPEPGERRTRNLQAALEASIRARDYWARSRNLRFLRFIHRLDAPTTGIMLLAKSQGALAPYSRLFESRQMQKLYLAVVCGTPRQARWTSELAIAPDPGVRGRMMALRTASGVQGRQSPGLGMVKPAATSFVLVCAGQGKAVVLCRPLTGRTHQIRLHLAASGWPVCGDPLYRAGGSSSPASFPPGNRPLAARPGNRSAPRSGNVGLGLRAIEVSYRDPFTGKAVRIEAPAGGFLERHGFAPEQVPWRELADTWPS